VCRARLVAAEREAETKRSAEAEYAAQLQIAMPAASEGMPPDLEEAGELVAALQRRLELEQRLGQARRNAMELEQQNHSLLDRQDLPVWLEASHTALVIVGVALFATGLLAGANAAAWIGGVMLTVLLALRIFKYVGEEQVASRREGLERQIDLVHQQIREAEREQGKLEAELGPVEGSIVVKLQAAERHLAELEKLLPIDSKRRDAGCEADAAARRAVEVRRQLATAEAAWRSKLAAAGLPQDWTPADVRAMAGRYEQVTELRMRVARRREDAEQRQREHATLCERIVNLAEEVGFDTDAADPPALLARLLSELRGHQTKVAERNRLRKRARELKAAQVRHRRAAAALRQRRETVFHQAGADDEAAYRRLCHEQQREEQLRREREMLGREITAAIGGHAAEEVFVKLLAQETANSLELHWEESSARLEDIGHQMHRLVEQRGAIGRQLEEISADHSLAERQLDLNSVEAKLEDAIRAWQVRAATCTVLERIRLHYEKHRQPETLLEASRLFENFTGGRYRRVWTPLAKNLLFVDTREGESLPVEVLSRGTREQLFLALRLALVSLFARRGVNLPVVLDDVLVNFDSRRAARAAQAVRDFGDAGHQVLVFTCHEHIAALFDSLGVDVRHLPDRFGEEELPALPAARRTQQRPQPPVMDEHELEVEVEEELQLEPPVVSQVPYTYATIENDEEDYRIHEPEEESDVEAVEELELAPIDEDEDTVLEAASHIPVSGRRQEPPVMTWPERDEMSEWVRVGPQVRRREAVTHATQSAETEDTTELDDYDDDDDDESYGYDGNLEAA
jgi:uncharacterized protein YhaN